MKKITTLAVAAVAISFASCTKDRTCTCTTTFPTGSGSSTSVEVLKKVSKRTGKANCFSYDNKDNSGNVTSSTSCSLS